MHFNHGEFTPEIGEEFEEEGLEMKITTEFEKRQEPEQLIIEKPFEYVPQDDYLEKELERQRQEDLEKMIPKRIP